jgi:hypothetical protein
MNQYTTMQTEEQAMAALRRQFTQYQYDEFVAMMEAGYAAVNLIKDYSNNPYGGYGNNDAYWNSGAPAQGGGGGSVKKFASGGYTSEGLGYLHDNEFIMDAQATRAAEGAARSNLTQQALINLFSGGGQGGGLVYNDQRRFDTAVSAEDRRAITQDTFALLVNLIP